MREIVAAASAGGTWRPWQAAGRRIRTLDAESGGSPVRIGVLCECDAKPLLAGKLGGRRCSQAPVLGHCRVVTLASQTLPAPFVWWSLISVDMRGHGLRSGLATFVRQVHTVWRYHFAGHGLEVYMVSRWVPSKS